MRLLFIYVLLTFYSYRETNIITGTILWDGEPMFGCEIKLSNSTISSTTETDGKFYLIIETNENNEKYDLEISYPAKFLYATTKIKNIYSNKDTLNLGEISLFINKIIDKKEFDKLSQEKKLTFQEVNHWTTHLGFISKFEIDSANVKFNCPYNKNKVLNHKYDKKINQVIVDFKDILNCRD